MNGGTAAREISRCKGQQQQHENGVVVTGRGGAVVPRRRFDGGGEEGSMTTAGAAGCRCRSCAAVMVADCVALGCCPCAVVSLLCLALVRAPLALASRCVGRLRWRRQKMMREKRVRDVAAASATASDDDGEQKCAKAEHVYRHGGVAEAAGGADHVEGEQEPAWLEEMYRTGHWGFGRVSFSAENPVDAARSTARRSPPPPPAAGPRPRQEAVG